MDFEAYAWIFPLWIIGAPTAAVIVDWLVNRGGTAPAREQQHRMDGTSLNPAYR